MRRLDLRMPDLRCFTIESSGGGDPGEVDDLPYARRVAAHLGVPLEVVRALLRTGKAGTNHERKADMLYTIAVVLIILWLLGMVGGYALGGFIHVLLVIALIVIVIRVIQGRRVV